MKTKYQNYMDRQHVSPELHQKLTKLKGKEQKTVIHWQKWAVLAASLILVIGIGLFAARRFSGVSSNAAGADGAPAMEFSSQAEEAAPMEADSAAGAASEAAVKESGDFQAAKTEAAEEESAEDVAAIDETLTQYATDFIGDAPNVVGIASHMTYPGQWQYDHVELHTDAPPYGLDIYLTGNGTQEETEFQPLADTAFALIGNLDQVTFLSSETGDEIASFRR